MKAANFDAVTSELKPENCTFGVPEMAFPVKTCVVCEEEFELRPDHPGYANRCRQCNSPASVTDTGKSRKDADELKSEREANEARRQAIRELLYTRK
jgi:hypothetical protein